MKNPEIEFNARSIVDKYDKQWFKFGEAAKIIGCGVNTVPYVLNEAGVTVKKIGTKKMVSAYDIAYAMCCHRVSPIDNDTRVAELYRTG